LYEVASGAVRGQFPAHSDGITMLAFTPDGYTLASADQQNTIRLWSTITGKEYCHFNGHQDQVTALAFAPDGRTLASGSADTTVLVWDVAGRMKEKPRQEADLKPRELETIWADLAGTDGRRAYRAVHRLAKHPSVAVTFLRAKIRPAPPAQVDQLIADLDSDQFAVRERARQRLETLDSTIEPALRGALENKPSLEVRRQLRQLLERLHHKAPSAEVLRGLRGLEALEYVGTEEARRLLTDLSKGAPGARLTREAQAAVRRLDRRATP
jgi:hypothetical protein